ncbi:MAG: M1 family aminopeptidase [Bacteroidota bacterium]
MKIVFTFLVIVLAFTSVAQAENHFCAEKHLHKGVNPTEKFLTVQQEQKANLYDVSGYFLDLNMTNQTSAISGTVKIYGKTIGALDSLILELHGNFTISNLTLNGIPAAYQRYGTVLAVELNASGNQVFVLDVTYAGTAPPISSNPVGVSGVYNEFVSAMNDRITFTISTPFYAHQWFPVKQIHRDKADSTRVHLTVPSGCKAASNGVLENTLDLGNGTTRYEWFNSHPIGYNLIFAAVAPFQEYLDQAFPAQLGGSSVAIQNYLYGSGTTLANMQEQCELIPDFMELFSDLFGLYPFADQRYGVLAAPFGGGMEHQTMPTIGTWEKKVTAHELSHMWWGDKVGFQSFSDIWLSEGFATYAEYLMLENLYPEEASPILLGWHSNVKTGVSGSVYHVDTLNLTRIYNSRLSYRKAASILHTLRGMISDDPLYFQAFSDYYNAFSDSTASSADFISSVENTTGLNLTEFADQWLYGEGYPRYFVRWNDLGSDLLIEISHTTSFPSVTPTFTNFLEIQFSRSSGTDTIVRFDIMTNLDQFLLQGLGEITGVVAIDPNNWIINNNGTIVQDPEFTVGMSILSSAGTFLFPNPTNGAITIKCSDCNYEVAKVYDLCGNCISEMKVENQVLELGNVPEGTYLIELFDHFSGKLRTERVTKL